MIHRPSSLRLALAFAAPLAFACGLAAAPAAAPAPAPAPSAPALAYPDLSPEDNARIAWWLDARYGMFIHWGVASLKGVELSWARGGSKPLDISKHPAGYVEDPVYDHLYKQFNPVDFNPREWVRIAQAAGMKYMVLTTKHHDGFCLWPSDLTDYDIMNTPFKRDVVKEFVDACREAGMRVGFYYSQRDWHHPAYGIGDNKIYRDYMNGQLTELLTRYGKIDVVWFDSYGTGDLKTFWGIEETWDLVKRLQPEAVINNRLAILGAYNAQGKPYWGDFDTPEQRLGGMQTHRPWESCMTLVGHQWGYKPGGEMYSLEQVIRSVVTCATGDGNLLLNVGPTPAGVIEQRQADLLREAGAWIARHERAIYGTRGGPYQNARWGGSTRRDRNVFIHVFDWRGEETLRLLPLPQTVLSARLLDGTPVAFQQSPAGLDLSVEKSRHDPFSTVIELTLDAPSTGLIQGPSLRSLFERGDHGAPITAGATLTLSAPPDGAAPHNPERIFSPDNRSALSTAQGKDPALTVDFGRERTLKGLRLEPANPRDHNLAKLQVLGSLDGTTWTELARATGPDSVYEFLTTRVVAGAAVPGLPVRYLKITVAAPRAILSLRHLQAYGQ